jgi:hypothetical protein
LNSRRETHEGRFGDFITQYVCLLPFDGDLGSLAEFQLGSAEFRSYRHPRRTDGFVSEWQLALRDIFPSIWAINNGGSKDV